MEFGAPSHFLWRGLHSSTRQVIRVPRIRCVNDPTVESHPSRFLGTWQLQVGNTANGLEARIAWQKKVLNQTKGITGSSDTRSDIA